jgi:hypothetical protein
MDGDSEFTYEEFLQHKASLAASFEVALMEACEKFQEKHGSIAQLDWFCSKADKYIQRSSVEAEEVTALQE